MILLLAAEHLNFRAHALLLRGAEQKNTALKAGDVSHWGLLC